LDEPRANESEPELDMGLEFEHCAGKVIRRVLEAEAGGSGVPQGL
jgi:hypothetical protein